MDIREQLTTLAFEPVRFYHYPSSVYERLFTLDCSSRPLRDYYMELEEEFLKRFKDSGFKCATDNKIVFEFHNVSTGVQIFVGFYDWCLSVGLAAIQR